MEEVVLVGQLLDQTLCPDSNAVLAAAEALDRFSLAAHFPFSLLTIAIGNLLVVSFFFCLSITFNLLLS